MAYRKYYFCLRIRPHNTLRVEFDYVHIYLRIRKGKGATGPVKNEEENTSGGVPITVSDINYCPENCVGAHQAPPRPFIPAFYI